MWRQLSPQVKPVHRIVSSVAILRCRNSMLSDADDDKPRSLRGSVKDAHVYLLLLLITGRFCATVSLVSVSGMWHFFYRFHLLTTLIIHHPSLFHSRLKTFLFYKSFPPKPRFSSSGPVGLGAGVPSVVWGQSRGRSWCTFTKLQ